MNLQLLVAALIVATAAGYLIRQAWRTWSAHKGSCGGCQCSPPTLISSDQLTLRRRR